MTITLTPPLRLAPNTTDPTRSIASEFGDSTPRRLSNYLRGGGLVPDTPANAGIPTTLPVRFSDFYGSSNTPPVVVTSGLVSAIDLGAPFLSIARITYENSGTTTGTALPGGNISNFEDWLSSGVSSDYEIRAVATGAAPVGSPLNTYLTLSTTRNWSVSRTTAGSTSSTVVISIRAAGETTILATGSISLVAETSVPILII